MKPDLSSASGEPAAEKASPRWSSWPTMLTVASVFFMVGMGFSHGLAQAWQQQSSQWRALAMDYKTRYEKQLSEHASDNADQWQGLAQEPSMPPLAAPEDDDPEPPISRPGMRAYGTFI